MPKKIGRFTNKKLLIALKSSILQSINEMGMMWSYRPNKLLFFFDCYTSLTCCLFSMFLFQTGFWGRYFKKIYCKNRPEIIFWSIDLKNWFWEVNTKFLSNWDKFYHKENIHFILINRSVMYFLRSGFSGWPEDFVASEWWCKKCWCFCWLQLK